MSNNKQEVRVFISSTFNDLHSERNFLNNVVFPKIRSFCNENGLQFIPVDLRWGISRQEEKNGKVLERCLSEIDESRPYFIGILGQRYGWVPSEEDQVRINISNENSYAYALNQLKENKSITHLEILHGVLNSPDMYDNSFFLFKNPSAVASVPLDLQGQLKENEKVFSDKLAGLKKKIENCLPAEQISEYDCTFNGLKLDWAQTPEIKLERSYKHKIIEICGNAKTKRISVEEYEEQPDALKNVLSKYVEFMPASEMYELASVGLLESMEKIWALSNEEFECLAYLLEDNCVDLEEFEVLTYNQKQLVHHFGYVDFKGFEEMGEWLTESLIMEIKKDRLDGAEDVELTGMELEISKHKAFQIEKLDAFVERPAVTKDLEVYINSDSDKPLLFTGRPGSGKSSIMAYLTYKLQESDDIDLCFRFVGATKKSNNITSLLVSIIEELQEKYEIERPVEYTVGSRDNESEDVQINFSEGKKVDGSLIDQEPKKLFRYFEYVLRTVGNKTKLVLILDAINQLSERDDAYLLTWLPFTCPENIRIICSSLSREEDSVEMISQNIIYESAERRELDILSISSLEAEEKKGIVTNILVEKYGKKQEAFPLDVLLQKQESNSPLYLYIASEELRTFFHFNEIAAFTANLPEKTIGIIEQLFKRLELEFGEQLVRDSLSLIVSSMYGLSESELGDILFGMYGENYQPQKWLALYHNLRPYLKRGTGDRSLIDFMHGQFVELVQKRYMPEKVMQYHYWNILGEYGERKLYECLDNTDIVPFNTARYALMYYTLLAKEDKLIEVIERVAKEGSVEGIFSGDDEKNEGLYVIVFDEYIDWLTVCDRVEDVSILDNVLKQLYYETGFSVSYRLSESLKDLGYKNEKWEFILLENIISHLSRLLGDKDDIGIDVRYVWSQKKLHLAQLYLNKKEYNQARSTALEALQILKDLSEWDSELKEDEEVKPFQILACVYEGLREYDLSLKYYYKINKILESLPEEKFTKWRRLYELSLNGICSVCLHLKKYDEALEWGFKCMEYRESSENIGILAKFDIWSTYSVIGLIYEEKGDYDSALKYQIDCLKLAQDICKEVPLGYEDILATSYNNISNTYQKLEEYDKALEYQYKCYKIYNELVKLSPEYHLYDYAIVMKVLADIYTFKGDYGKSLSLLLKALQIIRDLAKEYPEAYNKDILGILSNIGVDYYKLEDFSSAEIYYMEALEINRNLIKQYPDVYKSELINVLANIAILYVSMSDYNSAEKYYMEAFDKSGNNHANRRKTAFAEFLFDFAEDSEGKGDVEEALNIYIESLKRYRKIVTTGDNSYEYKIALILSNISVIYFNLNDIDNALRYCNESVEEYRRICKNPGGYESGLFAVLVNYGYFNYAIKDYKLSSDAYIEAVEVQKSYISGKSIDEQLNRAALFNEIGGMLFSVNMYKECKIIYGESLRIRRGCVTDKSGPKGISLSQSLNNMGRVTYKLGDYNASENYLVESLEIRQEFAEREPDIYLPHVGDTLYNLGLLHRDLLQTGDSVEYLLESYSIRKKLAEKVPDGFIDDFILVSEELQNYYKSLNDIEKANYYKKEIENIGK